MRKTYLDVTQLTETGVTSLGFVGGNTEVILAGTTIYSMDINFKKEYQKYADNYDVHFIFDDFIPSVKFYTVPYIDIMAIDSFDRFIGTIGQKSDIESDAPICYISNEFECFMVAENAIEFLENMKSWKDNLKLYDRIIFYFSKKEAE